MASQVLEEMLQAAKRAHKICPTLTAEIQALTAAIDALQRQGEPVAWIPVSERLPTEDDYAGYEDVLVRYRYTKGGLRDWDVGESFHDPDHRHNGGWLFGSCYHAKVSHWMPKSRLLAYALPPQPPTAPSPFDICPKCRDEYACCECPQPPTGEQTHG